MQTTEIKIEHLTQLGTAFLREDKNQHLVADMLIAINDEVSFMSWLEDCIEDPDAYTDYDSDDLADFLDKVQRILCQEEDPNGDIDPAGGHGLESHI